MEKRRVLFFVSLQQLTQIVTGAEDWTCGSDDYYSDIPGFGYLIEMTF